MSSSTTDAADEAGGEAVFSSDGLAPLPVPKAPSVVGIEEDRKEEDVLDSGSSLLDPSEAATRFAGAGTKEPPHVRLLRLQQEITILEQDLEGSTDAQNAMSQQTRQLAARLERLTLPFSRDELSAIVQENLATASATETTPPSVAVASSSEGTTQQPLEQRLVRLERALGASASSAPSSPSLVGRLDRMEHLLQRIDDKALDEAATRAKVIRADLEAASKARTKLGSSSSSNVKDSKLIHALHDQLVSLEGVSAHLPALCERLQQLSTLHVQTATFAGRLSSAETSLTSTQTSLTQLEEALTRVEQGLVDNGKVMDKNLQSLEQRLESL